MHRDDGRGGPSGVRLDEIPRPVVQRGGVVLEVRACGANRIDLLTRDDQVTAPIRYPHVFGSEVAGVVAEVGEGVDPALVGSRAVVNPTVACGRCELCGAGRENLCAASEVFGVQTDGGFAEFVAVSATQLVPLPDAVSFEAGASVIAAGATALQMLRSAARLRLGETVLVIAAGSGLGSLAVQIAVASGARVIATAGSEAKRARVGELGAEVVIDHREPGWFRQVRAATGGRGVDVVLEHVGAATWNDSLRSLARGGRLVTCGGHSGFGVELDLWSFFVKGQTLIGSFSASRRDVIDVLDLVAAGRIAPVVEAVLPLDLAEEALARLDAGTVFGKLVLAPAPAPQQPTTSA